MAQHQTKTDFNQSCVLFVLTGFEHSHHFDSKLEMAQPAQRAYVLEDLLTE